MRYFLLGIVMLFATHTWAQYGEVVSAISFNPLRTGFYKYLKVAKKAKLAGGIDACEANSAGQCTSSGNVNIVSRNGVEVLPAACAPGETCTPLVMQIKTIMPLAASTAEYQASHPGKYSGPYVYHTLLQTESNSVVSNADAEEQSNINLFTTQDISQINTQYRDTYAALGTSLSMSKGAKLVAASKTFVTDLHFDVNTPLVLKMVGDKSVVNLTRTFTVETDITLGGVTLEKAEIFTKNQMNSFTWVSKEGYSVLGASKKGG